MTVRAKAFIVPVAAGIALFVVLAMLRARGVVIIIALVAFALAQRAYLRTLRCPNCGVRFDQRMFKTGIWYHSWPRRTCWNCGIDMSEFERQRIAAEQHKDAPTN